MDANQKVYRMMLRDLVREQGEPEAFSPSRLQLNDVQLAVALTEYDHILLEAAERASAHVMNLLSGRLAPVSGVSLTEEMGILWRGLAREHAELLVRRDAELLADEMASDERIDNEFEVHV
jgi:hypothetical protein